MPRRSSEAPPSNGSVPRDASGRPRHPSAGNLGDRPVLVAAEPAPDARSTLLFPDGADFDPSSVRLGPGIKDEAVGRLVGNGEGKRVLELGCGDGSNAVALAKQGARVIVVDTSASRLSAARARAEEHDVRIEFHHGDLADLPFVRADQIDLCLAVYSLAEVADLARVFRQVHRVLRTEALFVISIPHPLALMTAADDTGDGVHLTRTAFDRSRIPIDGSTRQIEPHRITDVFTVLGRSNFRVDALLEPRVDDSVDEVFGSPVFRWVPATVVFRGRKQGI